MRGYGGVDVQSHAFPTLLQQLQQYFTPWPLHARERAPGTHCIGGWVGSGSSFREEKNLLTHAGNRTMIRRPYSLYPSHYTNYAIPACNFGKIKRNP